MPCAVGFVMTGMARSLLLLLCTAIMVAGCSKQFEFGNNKNRAYTGQEVTYIVIDKSDRNMRLYHKNRVLKSYRVQLGFSPVGDKERQGDGRTPEGLYRIDRKNPYSDFHLSLGISYPDGKDRIIAATKGVDPGGDIFIHGGPQDGIPRNYDWTRGCIAVSDRQIEEIYAMVEVDTPVLIRP